MRKVYCTVHCGKAHTLENGDPIDHACIQIPPAALRAELEEDFAEAKRIIKSSLARKPQAEAKPKPPPETYKGNLVEQHKAGGDLNRAYRSTKSNGRPKARRTYG